MAPQRHLLGLGELLVRRQHDMRIQQSEQRRGTRVRPQTLLPRLQSMGLQGTGHGNIIRAIASASGKRFVRQIRPVKPSVSLRCTVYLMCPKLMPLAVFAKSHNHISSNSEKIKLVTCAGQNPTW